MILLDTHIWVRWIEPDTDPLPVAISRMIDNSDQVIVSAVSCWEVAYLAKRNRIILPLPIDEWLQAALEIQALQACLLPRRWQQGQPVSRISIVIQLIVLLLRQLLKQEQRYLRLTVLLKIIRN